MIFKLITLYNYFYHGRARLLRILLQDITNKNIDTNIPTKTLKSLLVALLKTVTIKIGLITNIIRQIKIHGIMAPQLSQLTTKPKITITRLVIINNKYFFKFSTICFSSISTQIDFNI